MFGQYTFIQVQHHVALEAAVRNHSIISAATPQILARMYKLALEGLKQPVQETGFYTSSLRARNITLSSVTESKSGLWLQLAKVETQSNPYLTVGQKWAMESFSAPTNNVSTIFW